MGTSIFWENNRRRYKGKGRKDDVGNWFTIDSIGEDTFMISEYRHWEETHAYLLNGSERSLLIDTGLGIENIYEEVIRLTDKPVTAVATHIHWDHIGGHRYFPDFYVQEEEVSWLSGGFPLPVEQVRKSVAERCDLPEGFSVETYEIFQGRPARVLKDDEIIDIGGRSVNVLHTPGHSPGHMCFFEKERGWLFAGDLVYKGTLFAYYPSTDPQAYRTSLERVSALPVTRVFPGHHDPDLRPEFLEEVRNAFLTLHAEGKLHHGGGMHQYDGFAVWI